MKSPERQESEAQTRPVDPPLPQDQDAFPTLCGPGCSCGTPAKTGAWRIIIMLIVIAVVVISMIYKEII